MEILTFFFTVSIALEVALFGLFLRVLLYLTKRLTYHFKNFISVLFGVIGYIFRTSRLEQVSPIGVFKEQAMVGYLILAALIVFGIFETTNYFAMKIKDKR